MRFWALLLLVMWSELTLVSCSRQKSQTPLQSTYFDSLEGVPPVVEGEFESLSRIDLGPRRKAKSEVIQLSQQLIKGYLVEGTYLKSIANVKGKKRYQASSVLKMTPQLKSQIRSLEDRVEILEKMATTLLASSGRKAIFPFLSKRIIFENDLPLASLVFHSVDHEGRYHASYRDENFREVRTEILGSGFSEEYKAFIYPDSPLRSQIEELSLGFLQEQTSLENSLLSVKTDSEYEALPESSLFKFKPEEDTFDQVQVFYFVNQILNWYESSFKVNFSQKLEVQTQVGYPEKTNTMFYYSGKIRLGSGDGKSFENIMKDPSIVMHEATHFLVDEMAGLPFQGEGGSINEAFADTFTAIHLKSPQMAEASYLKEPYKRTLANNLRLQDRTGKLYADSLIISGTFWRMYQVFGEEPTKQILFFILQRLHPGSDFSHLQSLLQQAIVVLGPQRSSYNEILKEKGWL